MTHHMYPCDTHMDQKLTRSHASNAGMKSSCPADNPSDWDPPSSSSHEAPSSHSHWPCLAHTKRVMKTNQPFHFKSTQKGNLARPHSHSPQALQQPGGPVMHCHLHQGDWSFYLTNEQKKKEKKFPTVFSHITRCLSVCFKWSQLIIKHSTLQWLQTNRIRITLSTNKSPLHFMLCEFQCAYLNWFKK